jgi:hypothetical protein
MPPFSRKNIVIKYHSISRFVKEDKIQAVPPGETRDEEKFPEGFQGMTDKS